MKHYKSDSEWNLAIIVSFSPFIFGAFWAFFLTVSLASRHCVSPRNGISILSGCLIISLCSGACLSAWLTPSRSQCCEFLKATAVIVVDEMFWGNICSPMLNLEYCVQFSYCKTLRTKPFLSVQNITPVFTQSHIILRAWFLWLLSKVFFWAASREA